MLTFILWTAAIVGAVILAFRWFEIDATRQERNREVDRVREKWQTR